MLRDCSFAKEVWQQQLTAASAVQFFELKLEQWLFDNMQGQQGQQLCGLDNGLMFAVTYWLIWKQRNAFVFQGMFGAVQEIQKSAECMVKIIEDSRDSCGGNMANPTPVTKWCPPEVGWVKVNTDGATDINEERAKAAGVLRDSNGN